MIVRTASDKKYNLQLVDFTGSINKSYSQELKYFWASVLCSNYEVGNLSNPFTLFLTDIENVKGNETFSRGKNHKITWSANGNDIYYQGNSNKSLPVTMKVTYYLDGKKISPAKLVGKSGKIKIHYGTKNYLFNLHSIDRLLSRSIRIFCYI